MVLLHPNRCRLAFLAVAAALCLAACGGDAPEPPAPARPPNIVLVMADDLGYGDLGCYGQERILTPHLDRLAAQGARFTDFYAGATVCAPSRSVLMTGLHTGHTWIRGNRELWPMGQEPLPEGTFTVAAMLREAGYRTGLIGKWGLGGPGSTGTPERQGFDEFFGYLCQRHAHNYYPEFLFRGDERVPLEGNVLPEPKRPDGAGQAVEKAVYSHDVLVEEALAFIGRHRDRPFFLLLALTIPHANNEAWCQGMEVPDLAPYEDEPWLGPRKAMAAMVTRMDADVGRIAALLGDLGLEEDTLLLFTSDNGPHAEGCNNPAFFTSAGPFRGIKRDLYEGGIRVPMIARWPGHVPAGLVSDHAAFLGDVLALAAELAGTERPPGLDGVSFLPALLGRPDEQPAHPFLYWEYHGSTNSAQAVRMGSWKGVRRWLPGAALELYDLSLDPGEQDDLSGRHPDLVREILARMEEAHEQSPLWPDPVWSKGETR